MSVAAHSAPWEGLLAEEGLAPLDFADGAGGIKVGNRGSGKLIDSSRAIARASAAEERDQRRVLLTGRYKRNERRVVQMWATGLSTRVIARRTGMGRMTVYRLVKRISHRIHAMPEMRLGELLAACEPTTIVLVFALLERALEAPAAIRIAIGRARAVPAIRALLEPEEMRDG